MNMEVLGQNLKNYITWKNQKEIGVFTHIWTKKVVWNINKHTRKFQWENLKILITWENQKWIEVSTIMV